MSIKRIGWSLYGDQRRKFAKDRLRRRDGPIQPRIKRAKILVGWDPQRTALNSLDRFDGIHDFPERGLFGIGGEQESAVESPLRVNKPARTKTCISLLK